MSDAWIYSEDDRLAGELAPALAELGFSPRRASANGSLLPSGDDGATPRPPALVVVVSAPAPGSPPRELLERICDHEELGRVPMIASVDADHLEAEHLFPDETELLVRPFEPRELEARVARARRRVGGVDQGEVVRAGPLELNLATYQVTKAGQPVSFTYMEYELLKFLMTHPNRVFSREALLSSVWGYDYYGGARTVDVHIRRVRAKLEHEASRIKTVRSVGYRFEL
jgi:DNA-binding response OmpR family regulator